MSESPSLGLPYILAQQSQKHVTHNEAVRKLDALVQLGVLDRDLAAPPVSPADGDRYLIAASPTGAWAGQAARISAYQDGAWVFFVPKAGWLVWIVDEEVLLAYDGGAWVATGSGGGGGVASLNPATGGLVGINATADTTNRLSIASPASLFNHEGAGHRQKINKAAAGDTASLLFQTAFSGRAELGTTGDDDFHFKVSADGSSWNEAINIARATGAVSFPNTTITAPPTTQFFTASGTWSRPAGCKKIKVCATGGGGGAGSAQGGTVQFGMSGGGAAGTFGEKWIDVTAIASETVTIGAGGAGGGTGAAEAGGAGGSTSFGAHMTCPGGEGGNFTAAGSTATSTAANGDTAAATGADFSVMGGRGQQGVRMDGGVGFGGSGAPSMYSSGAYGVTNNATGRNAVGHGGGGSGCGSNNATVRAGGSGSPGLVIVEEYY